MNRSPEDSCGLRNEAPSISRSSDYADEPENAACGKLTPLLNAVILLRILSYLDPEAVCRFSRTCKWARAFVDENILRLPKAQTACARINVTPSTVSYSLPVYPNNKIQIETKSFDIKAMLSAGGSVALGNLFITFNSVTPQYFRKVLAAMLNRGVVPKYIEWKGPSGSLVIAHCPIRDQIKFRTYLADILTKHIEVIFETALSEENKAKILDLMLLALRHSFYTAIELASDGFTKEECIVLLLKVLKTLTNVTNKNVEADPYIFPIIKFRGADTYRTVKVLLDEQLIKENLASFCSVQKGGRVDKLTFDCPSNGVHIVVDIYQDYKNPGLALDERAIVGPVLEAIQKYRADSIILSRAFEALSYLPLQLDDDNRSIVVNEISNALEVYGTETAVVCACCNVVFKLGVADVTSHQSIARPLSAAILNVQDDECKRMVLFLLAQSLDQRHNRQFCGTGVVEAVLRMTERWYSYDYDTFDTRSADGWEFLSKATDRLPENIKCFLEANGISLMCRCWRTHPYEYLMQLYMAEILANIIQYPDLRIWLLNNECVETLCETILLERTDIDYDVGFLSVYALAHLIADGEEAWAGRTVLFRDALENFEKVAASLQFDEKKRCSHTVSNPPKSFLRFIPNFEYPALQHWSVWALANFTTTNEEYISYVYSEGGLPSLELLKGDPRTSDAVKNLACCVIENVKNWMLEKGTQ